MPSDLHESLIDEMNVIWAGQLVKKFGSPMSPGGVFFAIDHLIGALALQGISLGNKFPDFYINLSDGKGPVLGEVGNMPSGKWGSVLWDDGLPVRVLRIEFDFSVGILNPRYSRREVAMIKTVQRELWKVRHKYAVF